MCTTFFGGLSMQNEAACFVLGLGYPKRSKYVRWGMGMRDRAPGKGWERGYAKRSHLFRFGLVYVRQVCWRRLGAGLHETKPLASFRGWVTRDRAPGIVCGLVYVKQSHLVRLSSMR